MKKRKERNFILSLWPIVLSFIIGIAWFVRIEAQVLHLKERTREDRSFAHGSHSSVNDKLVEISIMLGRVEERIINLKKESKK